MNKEISSFAYISSHDLQEPLRNLQIISSRILEKEEHNLSETGVEYFHRLMDSAKRMQTLITDLLTYTYTNITERKFEETDLNVVLEEVKEELKETIEEKHAVIKSDELSKIDIIPFQFRKLFQNLISNSLKFSRLDKPPQITIKSEIAKGTKLKEPSLSAQGKYYHLSFADNGIGFEPHFRDRIFGVFQRLHGKEEYEGTGIGLAICKKIVENHHGLITATGELNKGAVFDIYLPLDNHNS